jgi:ribonucleoside-diphosphate reductase alpha chain
MVVDKIQKRDGRIVDFEPQKITNAIHKAILAVGRQDGDSAKRLSDQVVALVEKRFEGRLCSVEDVQDIVEEVLIKNGLADVAKAYIIYRQKRTELREAKRLLGVFDDLKLSVNSIRVLERRYLLRDERGNVIETPSQMFRRVAKAIASVDRIYGRGAGVQSTEEEFYRMMANLEFLPNSPTLMNAGTELGQLSACFVIDVPDSIEGIFNALKTMALIHQSGGGTGFSFSKLRPAGDIVRSTKGVASGPLSFMRIFDIATDVIKQGGKRRGANMGILRVDHPDIVEFITAKEKEGVLTNFNISVGITDEFMRAAMNDEEYDLINPRTGKPEKRLRAKDVFDLIVSMAWRTGDPGLIFLDEINRHNPTPNLGKIESTNPCVTGDTLVATDEGWVRMDELNSHCRIAGMDGEFHKFDWVKKTGVKEVFRVRTKAGYEVEATGDHKILTSSGTWKRVRELSRKDRLILIPNESFGKLHVDKEIAMMLGWIVGNGCATKNFEDLIFCFNTAEKLELLTVFKNYLGKINGMAVEPIRDGSKIRLKCPPKIAKMFGELGVKPSEKTIPTSVFKMDQESIKHFLSALFSSKGSVQGNRQKGVSIRLSSSSLPLLKQVQLLLLQFGIMSRVCENSRGPRRNELLGSKRRPKKYSCKAEHELVISRESMFRFMEKIGFCISSKNLKFDKIKPSKIYRDNIDLSVEKVERIGMREVYDLHEPVTHSFVANGIVVHNCGEVPLLPYESCNLGSINLSKMVEEGQINWDKLRSVVRSAVHFLDNVIDANKYPLREIEEATKRTRKIGLGVMGFADMLIKLGIPYDSEQAIAKAEEVMKFISDVATEKSVELAEERGPFPAFEESVWKGRGLKGLRNATLTTIAPTGSISIIANASSGIEPLFAISYVRNVMGTQLFEVNPLFEEVAKRGGFYSRELMIKIAKRGSVRGMPEVPEDVQRIFATALDIAPEWHVRMQAAFQKYVHNAVAKTVNLPSHATLEDVRRIFMMAYGLKCKGITVYRYGSKREQVLYVGPPSSVEEGPPTSEGPYVRAGPEYSGGCPSGVCEF